MHHDLIVDGDSAGAGLRDLRLNLAGLIDHADVDDGFVYAALSAVADTYEAPGASADAEPVEALA